jgi:ribosomal protein S18 acetylase RimI-like enzyme
MLIGYIVFSPSNARVKQFGVHPDFRYKGIGHALFQKVQEMAGDKMLTLINLDDSDNESIAFLQKIGFEMTVQQYEMRMEIN